MALCEGFQTLLIEVAFTYMLEDREVVMVRKKKTKEYAKVTDECHCRIKDDYMHHHVERRQSALTLITSTQFQPLGSSPLLSESRNHYDKHC